MSGGVLQKIMPARSQAQDVGMVVDLDALVAKPVAFQYRGKLYRVEAVTTETFLKLSDILAEIQELIQSIPKGRQVHDAEIYDAYYRYVSVLCPKFERETLRQMQLPQVHALVNLIIKHATGQPMNVDDFIEKKKMMARLGPLPSA